MRLDHQEILSDGQALTESAASTSYKDFGKDRNIGIGEQMCVVVVPTVAADATTGDETYTFAVQTDDNSSFSSATTLSSRAIAAASLTVGSIHVLPIPADKSMERYMRAYYTLAGTTPTITVKAALLPVSDVQNHALYATGSSVGS